MKLEIIFDEDKNNLRLTIDEAKKLYEHLKYIFDPPKTSPYLGGPNSAYPGMGQMYGGMTGIVSQQNDQEKSGGSHEK